MTAPRFEVVRTDADQPWHSRFRAANGRIVWTTEQYTRQRAAKGAIRSFVEIFHGYFIDNDTSIGSLSSRDSWNKLNRPVLEVRYVDERVTP